MLKYQRVGLATPQIHLPGLWLSILNQLDRFMCFTSAFRYGQQLLAALVFDLVPVLSSMKSTFETIVALKQ